jgi:hypothetical protein
VLLTIADRNTDVAIPWAVNVGINGSIYCLCVDLSIARSFESEVVSLKTGIILQDR